MIDDFFVGAMFALFVLFRFFAFQDMYNYGNQNEDKRLHYSNINIGFLKGSTRFEIGYGKKREGIFCVGGVCKLVPSSNGLNLSITSSF